MLTTWAPQAAMTAAWYPDPVPTSSADSPARSSSASTTTATISGWLIVWPGASMARARSS